MNEKLGNLLSYTWLKRIHLEDNSFKLNILMPAYSNTDSVQTKLQTHIWIIWGCKHGEHISEFIFLTQTFLNKNHFLGSWILRPQFFWVSKESVLVFKWLSIESTNVSVVPITVNLKCINMKISDWLLIYWMQSGN